MYYSTTKKLGSKNQKKIFAEGLAWPSSKGVFAKGLANGPRQRIFKKINIKSLPRALDLGPRQRAQTKIGPPAQISDRNQIGRASCRERV